MKNPKETPVEGMSDAAFCDRRRAGQGRIPPSEMASVRVDPVTLFQNE